MEYIDLGLPSGTLWAETNEYGYYEFDEGVEKYGNSLPTREQWEELQAQCQWEWMGNGCRITGPNGNTIVLPAEGCHFSDENVYLVGSYGYYWSSTPYGSGYAWSLFFGFSGVDLNDGNRCYSGSVRLIKKSER